MIVSSIKNLLRPIKRALTHNPDRFLEKVTGVVHVGANTGQERDGYNALGLHVIWVEPIPSVFAELCTNIQGLKNQRALQALVTDVDDKEYEFHIANNNGASSSILALDQHKDIWPTVSYTTTLLLKSTTLASLFAKEQVDASRYQALVMDTQGSELLVLQGGVSVLGHFKYIKTEVPDFESYKGCCQLKDIASFMAAHGYKEISRNQFATRAEGGSYYDIVYKKRG